jgi:hypothetical protein
VPHCLTWLTSAGQSVDAVGASCRNVARVTVLAGAETRGAACDGVAGEGTVGNKEGCKARSCGKAGGSGQQTWQMRVLRVAHAASDPEKHCTMHDSITCYGGMLAVATTSSASLANC